MKDLFSATGDPSGGAPRPKLPNMNEFSPGVVGQDLQALLKLISSSKDRSAAEKAISAKYAPIGKSPPPQNLKRAGNVLIGMSQCGLLEKKGNRVTEKLTPLGIKIRDEQKASDAHKVFARHLIQDCHGGELLDVVRTIRLRGEPVTLENIRTELSVRGFVVTENEGNSSKIRQWLEPSGVIDAKWNVDEGKLAQVVGATSSTLSAWASLPREQRIFLESLKTFAAGTAGSWQSVSKIKKVAESKYGPHAFPTGRLREKVIVPLETAGWLQQRGKAAQGGGRGGNAGEVAATKQLTDISITLPLEDASQIPPDLRSGLSTPIETIFAELQSKDTGVKGKALELLALNILRDVGLAPVGFRLRSTKTQGAEVDLLAEGANLNFGRWLVQCKNTPTGSLTIDQIAKEVGLAVVMQAHVVMMVTTGKIGATVRRFADGLAQTSHLQAVLIDGDALERYRTSKGAALIDLLNENALRLLHLKKGQRIEIPE